MPHYILKFLTIGFIFCISSPAFAQLEDPYPDSYYIDSPYGLSMHGAPKHDQEDSHFAYANPDAPKGGKLKMAAIGTFDTLNPYSLKGKAPLGMNLVYDRLMRRNWDEPFTMYPMIAESYRIAKDRSSISFELDERARFQDGTKITDEDVVFSFETLLKHGRPNMRKVYKAVNNIQKMGENGIAFHFERELYDQETALIFAMMPILSKSYWESRKFDQTTLETPKTNGPYRIKNTDPGRSITYERDPNYWAKDLLPNVGHHNFDEITYEYYRDDTVAFEALAAGELDLRRESDLRKWNAGYDFPTVQSGELIKKQLSHGRPEKARGFIFNTRREPFTDIRVREALELLLDRHQINKTLFNDSQKFITSYFPNSEFEAIGHDRPPETVTFDLRGNMRHASTLLKEAGWTIENGIQTKNSQPFEFELLLQHPEDEKIALNYKQNLKRLGITINIRVADSAGFLRRLQAYDYDMVLHHWQSSLSPGTEQVLYWGCEAAKQQGRFNYAGICDPEIDRLATAVPFTKTREELVNTMRALDAKLLEGHYMIPLFYAGADNVAFKSTIKHPDQTPLYGMVLESWWMDEQNTEN